MVKNLNNAFILKFIAFIFVSANSLVAYGTIQKPQLFDQQKKDPVILKIDTVRSDLYIAESFTNIYNAISNNKPIPQAATARLMLLLRNGPNSFSELLPIAKWIHTFAFNNSNDILQKNCIQQPELNNDDYAVQKLITTSIANYCRYQTKQDSENINTQKKATLEFKKISRAISESIASGNINNAKKITEVLKKFYNNNNQFIDNSTAWAHFIDIGKTLIKHNRPASDSILHYANTISSSENEPDSIFYMLWAYVYTNRLSQAQTFVNRLNLSSNPEKKSARLAFLVAYMYEKSKNQFLANKIYKQIMNSSPMSYYSAMAISKLTKKGVLSKQDVTTHLITEHNAIPISITENDFSPNFKSAIRRLSAWIRIGNQKILNAELEFVLTLNKSEVFSNPDIIHNISDKQFTNYLSLQLSELFIKHEDGYLNAFKIISRGIDQDFFSLSRPTLEQLFPTKYLSKIKKITSDLDPTIVLALIRQESAFNNEARSHVGARGLMQLMPSTAKRFKRSIQGNHLEDPNVNLKIGITYLKKLMKMYDGNIVYALAAYNAGENRVDKWATELFSDDTDPLLTIEAIPYLETRNYVKLILRNIFFYNLVSADHNPEKLNLERYYIR